MNEIERILQKLNHPGLNYIDLGLERVQAFLALLGSPHKKLPPVIHVAGTNGKGSLIANLHAIFEAAGYRVHRYISPHLVRFNERIVLAGKPISDDALLQVLERVYDVVKQQPVTFFEATTAAAFLAFSERPADIVLLETGMGGRLDATNVVDAPLLTAITPISLDHCNFLGTTLTAIAVEKAGIIKHGVPCVVGRQQDEASSVIAAQACDLQAPLYRMNHEWQLSGSLYQSPKRILELNPSLTGGHQYDNAATAVACIDMLSPFIFTDAQIQKGIESAVWPARLQRLTGWYADLLPDGMELWLDGGHNPQGAQILAQWFESRGIKKIHAICGMVKDKDAGGFLKILAPYIAQLYTVTIPDEPLCMPAEQLEMVAKHAGITADSMPSVEKALQTIAERAKTPAIVCICGSLYLAGKVLAANGETL